MNALCELVYIIVTLWVKQGKQGIFFLSTPQNKTPRFRHNSQNSNHFPQNYMKCHSDIVTCNYMHIIVINQEALIAICYINSFFWALLQSKQNPREFAEILAKEAHEFNGFNLIVADLPSKSMIYITNRPKGESVRIQEVPPGLHVLSNAKLDSPWPKVRTMRRTTSYH